LQTQGRLEIISLLICGMTGTRSSITYITAVWNQIRQVSQMCTRYCKYVKYKDIWLGYFQL